MTFQYNIKAIPTTYAGVNFRSRLEARWAAFFDLCGWKWDYEPFDLEGWAPDFLIRTKIGPVLCEVKPCDLVTHIEQQILKVNSGEDPSRWPFDCYNKAALHRYKHAVCLLGDAPLSLIPFMPIGVIDGAPRCAEFSFDDFQDAVTPEIDSEDLWRKAGSEVQWRSADAESFRPKLGATKFRWIRDIPRGGVAAQ